MPAGPVVDENHFAVCACDLPNDFRRREDLRDRETDAGNRIAHAIQPLRITDIDECQPPVEFVHTYPVDTADDEALCSGRNTRGRYDALRQA